MNVIHLRKGSGMASVVPAQGGGVRDWQRWTPYAAVAWSLIYAGLGVYWAVTGRGFPYSPATLAGGLGPAVGRLGPGVAWIIVLMAGVPAAALGAVMLRGGSILNGVRIRALRPLFISAGALLAGILLLFMIEFNLLIQLAYIPFVVFNLLTGAEFGQIFLEGLAHSKWTIAHQLLCLTGGFLWLAATLSYARRSGDACLSCGRRDGPEGWTSPANAACWGRIAVYMAMVVPILYALTRYAWALGIPLGMTEEYWRQGQARGEWISGLFLANFALVGAALMLGLVQRWGEVFPRWMVGLAGRRVPTMLALIPASIMSVLFMVAGIAMWSSYTQVAAAAAATEQDMAIVVGPVLLFPIWALALAVATLGYYYRLRGSCKVCGRGASGEAKDKPRPIP
jgi:hypothetical protein